MTGSLCPGPPRRVVLTGSSGLIGAAAAARLAGVAGEVVRLVRRAPRAADEVRWDPVGGVPAAELEGADAVVHLAGEPIAGRWTAEKRSRIARSRIEGTRSLVEALRSSPPRVLVSASAVGVYGADRGDERLTEDSGPGTDFLAEVARRWEEEALAARSAGVRVVLLRFGIVLSERGGALGRMLLPFRLGLGGRVGSGHQWMSWITLEDVTGLILRAVGDAAMEGPFNAVAGAVTNQEFTRTLGRVLRRPTLLPAPLPVLRLAYGSEMLRATLLASQRAEPARLQALGHRFRHAELESALRSILGSAGGTNGS